MEPPRLSCHPGSRCVLAAVVLNLWAVMGSSLPGAESLPWLSSHRARMLVRVDPVRSGRSWSPASVEIDLAAALAGAGIAGAPDESSLEVVAHDSLGVPAVFDGAREGYERHLLPWRLDRLYGAPRASLAFVLPDERHTRVAVYLDSLAAGRPLPRRYPGPVGDGDLFREDFQARPTAACRFDAFADLDGDGDLDLFRGGVEPFLHVLENAGGNRLVERGRLASGGKFLTLPHDPRNGRSWVVPHFHDLDRDGDLDLFPSFMDGPQARRIVRFENVTTPGGPLTFADRGPLATAAGTPIAGGAQEGGWFPSVVFAPSFAGGPEAAGDAGPDLIVGSNHRAHLHRCLGPDGAGGWRWAEGEALRAGGEEIVLLNPCLAAADVDGDRRQDLIAAPQSGQVLLYRSLGSSADGGPPAFAAGAVIAYDETYTLASTHPRATAADFTGDGLLDLALDRAWELADLRLLSPRPDFGALLANTGSPTAPRWSRVGPDQGAPRVEGFAPCDALRQNVVRAADWDGDGKTDLLAGDADGFVWLFRNITGHRAPLFAPGERLLAAGKPLSAASSGAHARHDVADWNGDGRRDLLVADGAGTVTVFLDEAKAGAPALGEGRKVEVSEEGGPPRPVQLGSRSHLLACDFDLDGRMDLVVSDQDSRSFHLLQDRGTGSEPRLAPPRKLPIDPLVRPNLGSFADWDGDGRKDLLACEFEHSIRLYRNAGSGAPGEEPRFEDPAGTVLLRPPTIMMISGVDATDWNRDGDLDLLTGQGHGGSGLRFYERDAIEDGLRGTHPRAAVERVERTPDLLGVVRRYADAMIEHGRDVHGPVRSLLFLSALDRTTLRPLEVRPAAPGGIRREDRAGLPWRPLHGANPHLDQNLLRVLEALTALTGERRYAEAADREVEWFFRNTGSPATGLLPWGEHLAWDVFLDRPISGSTELTHEFARPWALWEKSWRLAPEACRRFALGLWEHQIADHRTGGFDRHAPYDRHGPVDGKDFARHGAFYIDTWAHAHRQTGEAVFLRAIEVLLARFERKRDAGPGPPGATLGPLDTWSAAALVPEPLSSRLRAFAGAEDGLILEDLRRQFGAPGGGWRFPATWQAGYSSGVAAGWAMFALARWQQVRKPEMREVIVAVADAYRDALPAEDADVWPMSLAHVISAQAAAWRLSGRPVYLAEACRFARLAVDVFWDGSPLPRASFKTGHYETITGGDSLALALLDVHAAVSGIETAIPSNTIDR